MATLVLPVTISLIAIGVVLATVLFTLKQRRVRAQLTGQGFQELEIVVRGRYIPDIVRVRRDIPVRLYFRREEDAPCSERVIFSDFNAGARLLPHQSTPVSFVPTKCGEFLFTCAYGVYLGRLIVVEPTSRELAKATGEVRISAKTETTISLGSGGCAGQTSGRRGLFPVLSGWRSPVASRPGEHSREDPMGGEQ